MRAVKGSINEALRQVAAYNSNGLAEASMSKKQSLEDFAKAVGVDKKEQQWIMDNEDDFGHYHNNSALKKSWLSLSYPVYDGDYYFAFIGDNERENAKLNAEANRKLKQLAKSSMGNEEIFDEMSKLFGMTAYSNVGAGDTMTRDELWRAIQHIRKDYKEETEVEGYEELEEKALVGRMKMMARKILDKMRKRAKKIALPESLKEEIELTERLKPHIAKKSKYYNKQFDRKLELRKIKSFISGIQKLDKELQGFQNNAGFYGPSKIFDGLADAEHEAYNYQWEIEQGRWDGEIEVDS